MRKILLLILSTIFGLTTLTTVEKAVAQTQTNLCHTPKNNSEKSNICQSNTISLSQQKWDRLMKKYYRARYRTKFLKNNSFLSLNEVNNLLGFSGKRNKITKESPHQYLTWQDPQEPQKKIEGIFIYNQLVGLRSRGFDRAELQQIKTQIFSESDR